MTVCRLFVLKVDHERVFKHIMVKISLLSHLVV
jgi:hypothetical protein